MMRITPAVAWRRAASCLLLLIAASLVQSMKYAVITLQRDETEMLADWVLHHGRIFGYENLYIIDQQSETALTKKWLKIAEEAGANIIWFEGEYLERTVAVTNKMHEIFDANPDLEILIPIDADEFIIAQNTSSLGVYTRPSADVTPSYSADPELIFATLDALPRDGWKYKFNEVMAVDCPRTEGGEGRQLGERNGTSPAKKLVTHEDVAEKFDAPVHDLVPKRRVNTALQFDLTRFWKGRKTFYYRKGFAWTDLGNHRGRVKNDDKCVPELPEVVSGELDMIDDGCFHRTTLAIIHYGVRAISFDSWKAKTHRGATAHGFDEKTDCTKVTAAPMYCRQNQMILRDEEEAYGFWEHRVCVKMSATERSDFIVRAVQGDYSGTLDFPINATDPKIDP